MTSAAIQQEREAQLTTACCSLNVDHFDRRQPLPQPHAVVPEHWSNGRHEGRKLFHERADRDLSTLQIAAVDP
jgi:hypothetical protein